DEDRPPVVRHPPALIDALFVRQDKTIDRRVVLFPALQLARLHLLNEQLWLRAFGIFLPPTRQTSLDERRAWAGPRQAPDEFGEIREGFLLADAEEPLAVEVPVPVDEPTVPRRIDRRPRSAFPVQFDPADGIPEVGGGTFPDREVHPRRGQHRRR